MRITIVTPAPKGTRLGNRVTALRLAALLRYLGHCVRVRGDWAPDGAELIFALHARKSAAALRASRTSAPEQKRILILTGTDVYDEIDTDTAAQESLRIADRLIVLQGRALERLPAELRSKARVVLQSARAPNEIPPFDAQHFDVCVLAHLRAVKDPLLAARAARLLPPDSRLRVRLVGSALDDRSANEARAEEAANPRLEWLGDRPHGEALGILAGSRLMVLSSHNEGGPAVVTEAIACGVPIVSTRIPAAEALLGADHPGLFPVGNSQALAALLDRCERDATFLEELERRSVELQPSVDPCREVEGLRRLLAELQPLRPRE